MEDYIYILPNTKDINYKGNINGSDCFEFLDKLSGEKYCIAFTTKSYFYKNKYLENTEFFKIKFINCYYHKFFRKTIKYYHIRRITNSDLIKIKEQYPEYFI